MVYYSKCVVKACYSHLVYHLSLGLTFAVECDIKRGQGIYMQFYIKTLKCQIMEFGAIDLERKQFFGLFTPFLNSTLEDLNSGFFRQG